MPQGYLSQDTHKGGLLPSPLRDTWPGGSHCEIQTRGEFQLLKNLTKLEEEQMMLQAAESLASRNAAGGRETPLSNANQQV